jgi:hypothetical protein
MPAPGESKFSESAKRTKAENTTAVANEIIVAETEARKSKTARLRATRLAQEPTITKAPAKKTRRALRQERRASGGGREL